LGQAIFIQPSSLLARSLTLSLSLCYLSRSQRCRTSRTLPRAAPFPPDHGPALQGARAVQAPRGELLPPPRLQRRPHPAWCPGDRPAQRHLLDHQSQLVHGHAARTTGKREFAVCQKVCLEPYDELLSSREGLVLLGGRAAQDLCLCSLMTGDRKFLPANASKACTYVFLAGYDLAVADG